MATYIVIENEFLVEEGLGHNVDLSDKMLCLVLIELRSNGDNDLLVIDVKKLD